MIDWLRKQVKNAPDISASKQEGRLVREDKSNAVTRLIEALDNIDLERSEISESLARHRRQR